MQGPVMPRRHRKLGPRLAGWLRYRSGVGRPTQSPNRGAGLLSRRGSLAGFPAGAEPGSHHRPPCYHGEEPVSLSAPHTRVSTPNRACSRTLWRQWYGAPLENQEVPRRETRPPKQ